jgi:hypothetical protein
MEVVIHMHYGYMLIRCSPKGNTLADACSAGVVTQTQIYER